MKFRVSVSDKTIGKQIGSAIDDGIRDAADRLTDSGRNVARAKIRAHGRVWRQELLRSFVSESEKRGNRRHAVLRNTADHAAVVEHGAKYTTRGPPVEALIPWVLSKWHPGSGEFHGDGPGGSSESPKSSTSRSRSFSTNRKIRSSVNDFDYNQLADDVLGDLVTNDSNFTNQNLLSINQADDVESRLFNHPLVEPNTMRDLIRAYEEWKESSHPSHPEVQYISELSKRTFNVPGETRGQFDGDLVADDFQSLLALRAMTHLLLRERFGAESSMPLHRGMQRDAAPLFREMWNDPTASSWAIDKNVVENYAIDNRVATGFSRGLVHSPETDLDDILVGIDLFNSNGFRNETEVHVIHGDGVVYNRSEILFTIVDGSSDNIPVDSVLGSIAAGEFSSLSDAQLITLGRLVVQLDRYELGIQTPAGQSRLIGLRDEVTNRNLADSIRNATAENDFSAAVDRVLSYTG